MVWLVKKMLSIRDKQTNQPKLSSSAWINIIYKQLKAHGVREREHKHEITCDVLSNRKIGELGGKNSQLPDKPK